MEMGFSHQQQISKISTDKANALAQLHIEIKSHLRHFCAVCRNWRCRKHHIFQKQPPGNSRDGSGCHRLTPNKLIRLLQTVNINGGGKRSPKEITTYIKPVGIEGKMIAYRFQSIHFSIACHLVVTITHFAGEALQHKGISQHGQAELHISNRIDHTLYLVGTICNRQVSFKGWVICRTGDMQRTICRPHGPFHIIRQGWQQTKVSILQGYCQIHLLIVIRVISFESSQGSISRHHHSVGIISHHFLGNKRLHYVKSLILQHKLA